MAPRVAVDDGSRHVGQLQDPAIALVAGGESFGLGNPVSAAVIP